MDSSAFTVGLAAAGAMAMTVWLGAWVALRWHAEGLRRSIHDNPVEVAAFAAGFVLLGVAVLFFVTIPWGR